jgi:hypothetical protein
MKSLLKWGLIAFVGLVILGALFGKDDKSSQTQTVRATAGTAKASTATETSPPAPTPDPKVSVTFSGPSTVNSDSVVLKGSVHPASAHVRIKGQPVEVRHGHWKLPVTLTKHGDNTFSIVATRQGFVKDTNTAVVTRELSAAEKAVIRQQNADRRANHRALEAAQNYLALSGMSRQGLYEQLSSSAGEGFTSSQAQWAVDHARADWNKEAVQSARSYLEIQPMSRADLIDQLTSSAGEGFTYAQALYAVNKVY